jgi:hypothetical protein
MGKRTRHHTRSFIDQDYLSKLSTEERAWLERFNDAYYRADFGDEPHKVQAAFRRDSYGRQNARARELLTAPPRAVAEQLARIAAAPRCAAPRYYRLEDYAMFAESTRTEDALLEVIDQKHSMPRLIHSQDADSIASNDESTPLKRTA